MGSVYYTLFLIKYLSLYSPISNFWLMIACSNKPRADSLLSWMSNYILDAHNIKLSWQDSSFNQVAIKRWGRNDDLQLTMVLSAVPSLLADSSRRGCRLAWLSGHSSLRPRSPKHAQASTTLRRRLHEKYLGQLQNVLMRATVWS